MYNSWQDFWIGVSHRPFLINAMVLLAIAIVIYTWYWIVDALEKLREGKENQMNRITGRMFGEVDDKRFRLPGVALHGVCPKCHEKTIKDFSREYISYPVVGQEMSVSMYCNACEHEWEVPVILEVSLKLIEKPNA